MKQFALISFLSLLTYSTFAQSLAGVESVEYDPINNRYLASSDGSSIVAIAPNGGLSHFGVGATADYGMEVMNGTLFVVSGNSVKGYDLISETEVMDLGIGGTQFLNGMGSDGVSKLWVSDFNGFDIYEIDVSSFVFPSFVKVADENDLGTTHKPNGIVYDGDNNRILIAGWGTNAPIRAMDLTTNNVTDVVANTGLNNIDGIDRGCDGSWYVSSWGPAQITKYSNDFSTSEIITVPGINNPADICYSVETDTLAIPGGDQVLFVGFECAAVGIEEETFDAYSIHYSSGYPVLHFELLEDQNVSLDIVDMSGRVVYSVFEGMQPKGLQTVVLSSIGLYSGNYICRMRSKELSFSERVVIP